LLKPVEPVPLTSQRAAWAGAAMASVISAAINGALADPRWVVGDMGDLSVEK
jgi:hypothetical protein